MERIVRYTGGFAIIANALFALLLAGLAAVAVEYFRFGIWHHWSRWASWVMLTGLGALYFASDRAGVSL